MPALKLNLPRYHGPLDLLVHLVRKAELDILDIALADVTQPFLSILETLVALDLEEAGDFLVLAAQLLEWKSQRLLPPTNAPVEADDETSTGVAQTREELIKRLEEYRRYRTVTTQLAQQAARRAESFVRAVGEPVVGTVTPKVATELEIELWDLVAAFGRVLKAQLTPVGESVFRETVPIAVWQTRLVEQVAQKGPIALLDLFGRTNTRVEAISKFLALLELIKQRRLWIELETDGGNFILSVPTQTHTLPTLGESVLAAEMVEPLVVTNVSADTSQADHHLPEAPATRLPADPLASTPAATPHMTPERGPATDAWADFEPLDEES